MKESLLDTQKDLAYQQQFNSLVKSQLEDVVLDRNKLHDIVKNKDELIDRLKAEIIGINKALQSSITKEKDNNSKNYDEYHDNEYNRLLILTDKVKDREIEIERLKMEGKLKDKEYIKLKDQYIVLQDENDSIIKQNDIYKYENQKVKDEQASFIEDLSSIRSYYESQLDGISSKLHKTSDDLIITRNRYIELEKENSLLKNRAEEWKRRAIHNEVELEQMVNERLKEINMNQKISNEVINKQQEDHQNELLESRESYTKNANKLRSMVNDERNRDTWIDDQNRLDWDGLLYKLNNIGASKLT